MRCEGSWCTGASGRGNESIRLSSGRQRRKINERGAENDLVNLMLASYHGNKVSLLFQNYRFLYRNERMY
jgi:hypothetical protein